MKKYNHLKEKAVKLRKNGYSLNDICKRLNKGKSTVYYWIKDVTIEKVNVFLKRNKGKIKKSSLAAGKAVRKKFRLIHKSYKERAEKLWDSVLKNNNDFLLFLMCYACEGSRKSKHAVGIANSDPSLINFCVEWFRVLNIHKRRIECYLQIHVDQDEKALKDFWKELLSINPIITTKKSNSNKMTGRVWASKYGVIHLKFNDAYTKTMLDTWLNLLKQDLNRKINNPLKNIKIIGM